MSSTTPGSDPERPHDDAEHEPAPYDESGLPASPDSGTASDAAEDSGPGEPIEPEPAPAEPEPEPEPELAGPIEPGEPVESPDATARLDAAVERANAASDVDETGAPVPEPVPADSVGRETYVPSATVAGGTAAVAGAATAAPEPQLYVAPQPAAQTVYVQAPTPPKSRGNRGFGVLVALIGTVVFALLYAGVAYLLITVNGAGRTDAIQVFTEFLTRPVYWVPIAAFLIGFAILAAIVNRGAWWNYAVFGLLVAAFVYFSYIGGALLTVEAWTLTVDEAGRFIGERWLDPFAIAAFIIAREIPIWLGGWIAARGRTVAERNRLALEAYDRELAAGPQAQR